MVYDKLIDYFNSWNRHLSQPNNNLQFDDRGAFGVFRGLRLYSAFQPVFSSDTLRPMAYEALLRARTPAHRAISPAEAFAQAKTLDEVVYLDRLCRMVHVINYFTQNSASGDLFLNVSGGHLMRVDTGHGSVFETLLGHCGIDPTQVVLEILEANVDDLQHLQEAVMAYRSRGFRVAIDDFGSQHSNFDRLWQLTPDIVKIDRSLIVQAESNCRARRILPKLVEIIHDLGAQVVCEGIETHEQHALVLDSGADLLQGYYYARPTAEVLPQAAQLMAEAA
ncbi:MAG: EAL domain-containing protein [Betaproteobacteria bacterium]